MKWSELEQKASELEQKAKVDQESRQTGGVSEREIYWQEQHRQLQREEAMKQAAEKRQWERARTVLEKLQAEEALTAIREEIWQEGQVVNDTYTKDGLVGRGFQLRSDPYPMVCLHSIQGELRLVLEREHMALGVFFVPYEHDEDDQFSKVVVRSHKNYSFAGYPRRSFIEAIKLHGLERGLNRKLLEDYRMYPEPSYIFPDQEDAAGRLAFALVHQVNFMVDHQSLPAQLRKRAEDIVSSFPPFLRERGELKHTELRQWGHQQIGSSRWMRLLDRVYPVKI